MDFASISDFLDLIKNPDKYQKTLKSLEDRTAELNKAILVYGKASEIEPLNTLAKQNLEKSREKIAQERAAFDLEVANARAQLLDEKAKVAELQAQATVKIAEATVAEKQAKEIQMEYARKQQDVEKQQAKNLARENELAVAQQEVNEKLQKLNSLGL